MDIMADLDFIMRKIFMNVTITDQKVADITQNSPFRELCLDTDSAMVTSKTTAMNLWRRAKDIIPLVPTWNGEMSGFLQQERKPQLVAVTY
ncbi:MAG: hypothetical protein Q8P30_04795 [Candidatus Uhrbacteria bacterium]|nr:hypothetical protein [Candidatus Uhrbacteria bacterium]